MLVWPPRPFASTYMQMRRGGAARLRVQCSRLLADCPCCSLLSAGLCTKMNEDDLARLENAAVHVMVSVCPWKLGLSTILFMVKGFNKQRLRKPCAHAHNYLFRVLFSKWYLMVPVFGLLPQGETRTNHGNVGIIGLLLDCTFDLCQFRCD